MLGPTWRCASPHLFDARQRLPEGEAPSRPEVSGPRRLSSVCTWFSSIAAAIAHRRRHERPQGNNARGGKLLRENARSAGTLAAHPPAMLHRNDHGAARAPLRREAERAFAREQPPARVNAQPRARAVLLRG